MHPFPEAPGRIASYSMFPRCNFKLLTDEAATHLPWEPAPHPHTKARILPAAVDQNSQAQQQGWGGAH